MQIVRSPSGPERRATGSERAPLFDAWLQTALQEKFDDTLDETLPAELLDLLSDRSGSRADH